MSYHKEQPHPVKPRSLLFAVTALISDADPVASVSPRVNGMLKI